MYNKTAEHEVIYFKECGLEEDMNIIELTVLRKLDKYRETSNRDRFVLPLEETEKLFTTIIEKTINNYFL